MLQFRILAVTALIFLLHSVARASEEMIHPPHEISISADAGPSFGEARLTITLRSSDSNIDSIDLSLNGKPITVPEKAYQDLPSPLLSSAQIRTEAGRDGIPWLYIYFELEHRMDSGERRPKRVHIAFQAGRARYRSIETPTLEGYEWKKEDF